MHIKQRYHNVAFNVPVKIYNVTFCVSRKISQCSTYKLFSGGRSLRYNCIYFNWKVWKGIEDISAHTFNF
jgi:hypothetical protein